jgi:hypothetical protein
LLGGHRELIREGTDEKDVRGVKNVVNTFAKERG